MVYFAPCKINLGLNITNKRDDGYHEISTVMTPVEKLCDIVEIVFRSDDNIVFSSSGIEIDCLPEKNLCVKAYKEFKKHYDIGGVELHLHKKVPFGAGLGSGSSDATSVLLGLNDMFECGASEESLKEMAASLGSDTVFFVNNKIKLCEGRGEILTDLDVDISGLHVAIVKPNIHISSGFAYKGITPKIPELNVADIVKMPLNKWKGLLVNDFEEHIFNTHPELKQIKEALYESGADYVAMSGSGSSLFSISYNALFINDLITTKNMFLFQNIL